MTNQTIKALRDALTEIQRFTDSPVIHAIAKRVIALTSDASEDAPADPIILNGMPVENIQLDWVCSLLTSETIFNGADLLQAFDKLVAFYVANRAAARPAPVGAAPASDFAPLLTFYNVTTLAALARMQEQHINRLQAKLPRLADEFQRTPREG